MISNSTTQKIVRTKQPAQAPQAYKKPAKQWQRTDKRAMTTVE